jgi:8-oxo-dGTP diphosphatase
MPVYNRGRIANRNNEGREMARTPVLAAGGIVTQRGNAPLIAVVRLRKRNEWVLPKGKLEDGETPRAAAEREVLEETGHQVSVHEFLGTLAYEAGGRSKVVHYWRMEADREQTLELMNDVKAVAWLPLDEAVERLTRGYEQAFLAEVGPLALEAAAQRAALPRRPAAKRAASAPPRPARAPAPAPVPTPTANINDDQPAMASDVADTAPAVDAAERDNAAVDTAAAVDIAEDVAESDSPALAPEPFTREYPVAPRSPDRSKTLLEKAWLWLRRRT